ncbi:MAG TPA: zinc-binding dehydrogenase [Vicinamibacterales bacterium]|nr:zinc-binding dehydrogenase [Vicinamibacterales bacterium]
MRSVRFHTHGGIEVLRYEEAPDPEPKPGEVLVRVRACALNHLDLWERRGLERVRIPLPHISGSDVAGEIVESTVADLPRGRRVMLQPGISCGRCVFCQSGRDNECAQYEVLGYLNHPGGYAELVSVPAQNIVPIPDAISFIEAAAFPLTFLTAWHMLVGRAHVQRDEDVLVLAAGSGVGQAAIQIAVLLGARVIATAGSREKLERARALGASELIDHHRQDVADEVRRLTDRRGVDVVIEHVGQATWAKAVRSLARGGRLVTCGATTGSEGSLNLQALFAKQLSILGSYMGSKGELLRAARLFFSGRLKPAIDRTYPLAEAAEAQRRLEASEQFGKIVLEV